MHTVHLVHESPASRPHQTCADCASHDWCLPAELGAKQAKRLDHLNVHPALSGAVDPFIVPALRFNPCMRFAAGS